MKNLRSQVGCLSSLHQVFHYQIFTIKPETKNSYFKRSNSKHEHEKRHNSNLKVRHYENTNACAKNRSRCRLKFLTLSEGAPPKKRKNRRGKKSKSSHISPSAPGHLRQAPSLFRMRVPPAIIIRISIRAKSLTCPYLYQTLVYIGLFFVM